MVLHKQYFNNSASNNNDNNDKWAFPVFCVLTLHDLVNKHADFHRGSLTFVILECPVVGRSAGVKAGLQLRPRVLSIC